MGRQVVEDSSDLGSLSDVQWHQLEDAASRFEEALKRDPSARLAAYLPRPTDLLRGLILQELIKVDLEFRWKSRQQMLLESYRENFAELGPAEGLPVKLIFEEYLIRHLFGDKPALASYRERFPRQYPELEREVGRQARAAAPEARSVAAPAVSKPARKVVQGPPAVTYPGGGGGLIREAVTLNIAGGLVLIRKLGTGPFGEVWRAQGAGDFSCAVKFLLRSPNPDDEKHELQVLKKLGGLRHSFLLTTYSRWFWEDWLCIVMELADRSLWDRFQECRKQQALEGVPKVELLRNIREAAEALDFLHRNGARHGDIKPQNLLLLGEHVKLADHGLSWRVENQDPNRTIAGLPPYLAPEAIFGDFRPQSDQFSLAASYAELRHGRRPFRGILRNQPDLKGLPEKEQQALCKALDPEPGKRFPSCQVFAQALTNAALVGIV
jgi:hypothetical protein